MPICGEISLYLLGEKLKKRCEILLRKNDRCPSCRTLPVNVSVRNPKGVELGNL